MQPPTVGTEQLVTLALAIDEREGVRVCRACMREGKHPCVKGEHPYIIVRGFEGSTAGPLSGALHIRYVAGYCIRKREGMEKSFM